MSITPEDVLAARDAAGSLKGGARLLGIDYHKARRLLASIGEAPQYEVRSNHPLGSEAGSGHRIPDAPWHDRHTLLTALYKHDFNISKTAAFFGCTRVTIRRKMSTFGIDSPHIKQRPVLVPREDVFFELYGDALVVSDLHLPLMQFEILGDAIEDALAAGIKQCVIVGDLLNGDALANHEEKQESAGMSTEIEHATHALVMILESFDAVYVTRGNHDRHAAKALKLGKQFDKALRLLLADVDPELLKKLHVSNKDRCYVDTLNGRWLLAHTYTYSRIAMTYPMKLAVRYNIHVPAAHRHHHGVCVAPNGKYAVELGGLFDAQRMAYIWDWTNDLPEMVNGFMLLINGRPRLPMLTG